MSHASTAVTQYIDPPIPFFLCELTQSRSEVIICLSFFQSIANLLIAMHLLMPKYGIAVNLSRLRGQISDWRFLCGSDVLFVSVSGNTSLFPGAGAVGACLHRFYGFRC